MKLIHFLVIKYNFFANFYSLNNIVHQYMKWLHYNLIFNKLMIFLFMLNQDNVIFTKVLNMNNMFIYKIFFNLNKINYKFNKFPYKFSLIIYFSLLEKIIYLNVDLK